MVIDSLVSVVIFNLTYNTQYDTVVIVASTKMEDLDLSRFYGKDFPMRKIPPKELKSSARAQAIEERSHLNSADGRVIDKHDQFYRDHKLLLKLFQVTKNKQIKI